MDRRQLEYFVAIVDNEGFTRASYALHVAQSSLSQAIKALEGSLGVSLFERLGHGVRLTESGKALLGPARQTLRDFEMAREAAVNLAGPKTGRLDIAATAAMADGPVADILGSFHAMHPGVAIRLRDPKEADVVQCIRSGEAEVGFVAEPAKRVQGLHEIRWAPGNLFLAMPPDPAQEQEAPIPAAVIAEHDLILVASRTRAALQRLGEFGATPKSVIETDHHAAILPLVLQGVGSTILFRSNAERFRQLGATVRELDAPGIRYMALIHRPSLSPPAEAFVEFARQVRDEESGDPAQLPPRLDSPHRIQV